MPISKIPIEGFLLGQGSYFFAERRLRTIKDNDYVYEAFRKAYSFLMAHYPAPSHLIGAKERDEYWYQLAGDLSDVKCGHEEKLLSNLLVGTVDYLELCSCSIEKLIEVESFDKVFCKALIALRRCLDSQGEKKPRRILKKAVLNDFISSACIVYLDECAGAEVDSHLIQ